MHPSIIYILYVDYRVLYTSVVVGFYYHICMQTYLVSRLDKYCKGAIADWIFSLVLILSSHPWHPTVCFCIRNSIILLIYYNCPGESPIQIYDHINLSIGKFNLYVCTYWKTNSHCTPRIWILLFIYLIYYSCIYLFAKYHLFTFIIFTFFNRHSSVSITNFKIRWNLKKNNWVLLYYQQPNAIRSGHQIKWVHPNWIR